MSKKLRVIVVKPSKYQDGFVDRFRWGLMPNATISHIASMTPSSMDERPIIVHTVDEQVETCLSYLKLLHQDRRYNTLVALVGGQSHQFKRALDLAAYAKGNGIEHVVIGGPHVITCGTDEFENRGISFAFAEAELVWPTILRDAIDGLLQSTYGQDRRWQQELDSPTIKPPSKDALRRYIVPMQGLYPTRGCPFTCNFCSVIKIAGRTERFQPIQTTIASLKAAKKAGVRLIMFVSDNINKYPQVEMLLNTMIEENIRLPFFVQCDTQIAYQEELVELLSRAGCFQMFVGVESFSRVDLRSLHKSQNHPEKDQYQRIVALCRKYGVSSHFSNIIGLENDTEASILEHRRILKELNPDVASFYILCPIPGTEQYDEFMERELITDRDLNHFDATRLTWLHPNLTATKLQSLLLDSYKEFYSSSHIRKITWSEIKKRGINSLTLYGPAYALFNRYAASQDFHPMSGGVKRIKLSDTERMYKPYRQKIFGTSEVGLPRTRELPLADAEMNRKVRIAL